MYGTNDERGTRQGLARAFFFCFSPSPRPNLLPPVTCGSAAGLASASLLPRLELARWMVSLWPLSERSKLSCDSRKRSKARRGHREWSSAVDRSDKEFYASFGRKQILIRPGGIKPLASKNFHYYQLNTVLHIKPRVKVFCCFHIVRWYHMYAFFYEEIEQYYTWYY